MTEGKVQTNMELTPNERLALKHASGYPYSHGAIVGGVRALIADWEARGTPELQQPAKLPGRRMMRAWEPEPAAEVEP